MTEAALLELAELQSAAAVAGTADKEEVAQAINAADRRATRAESDLLSAQDQLSLREHELCEVIDELDASKVDLAELKAKVTKLGLLRSTATLKLSKSDKLAEELKASVEELETDKVGLTQQIDDLNRRSAQYKVKITELGKDKMSAEAKATALRTAQDTVERQEAQQQHQQDAKLLKIAGELAAAKQSVQEQAPRAKPADNGNGVAPWA